LRKAKTYDVTSAKPVLSLAEGAAVQSEKAGFPLEFTPHFDAGRE